MKKIKHWKQILFPCLSVGAISTIIIPAACIAASPKFHIHSSVRWACIEQEGQHTLDYTFFLYKAINLDKQYISIEIKTVHFLDDNCHAKLEGKPTYGENRLSFTQQVGLYRNDGKALEPGDLTSFNFYIKLKNKKDHKTIWSDSLLNIELKYNPR